jgi:hypothetical protein
MCACVVVRPEQRCFGTGWHRKCIAMKARWLHTQVESFFPASPPAVTRGTLAPPPLALLPPSSPSPPPEGRPPGIRADPKEGSSEALFPRWLAISRGW